ncbi:MAG: prepilin-type N-terminal cleavage/methylation domain-containing protein [Candidatus Pacebacteria bacterium]|nr:prepilin-type N-terminal cleavage/methylation domain-containing protein [Candidatus Paceibacterota bacterium]
MLPKSNNFFSHCGGYTLVEMMLVLAITGIIMPALYLGIHSLYDTHGLAFARSLALVEASNALEDIVRDVRAMVYGADGSVPLVAVGTSTVTFYADTDFDGQVERVRYFLDGTVLRKGVMEPDASSQYVTGSETITSIAEGVTNGATNTNIFTYYNATGTVMAANSGNVLTMRRVSATINTETMYRGKTGTATLSSSASMRNLKNIY